MDAGIPSVQAERARCILVVSLPTGGLLEGFEPGKWTIVETFFYEGEAKLRLHQIRAFLTELQARALVVVTAASHRHGTTAIWSTAARFNSAVAHITAENAVQASPQASAAWTAATSSFSPPAYVLLPPQSKSSTKRPIKNSKTQIVLVASVFAALVASVGMATALWRNPVQIKADARIEFARRGGVYASIPDKDDPDWYIRVRFNPNGTKDIIDRFPASDLEYRRAKGDLDAIPVEFLNTPLNGFASAFRPKS